MDLSININEELSIRNISSCIKDAVFIFNFAPMYGPFHILGFPLFARTLTLTGYSEQKETNLQSIMDPK